LIVSQEKSFRHAHIHLTAHELTRRMAEAVSEEFRVASSALDKFLAAREVKVVEPLEVIRKIAEERKFSQKVTDQVLSGYLAESESNWFGVVNAFTHAAQNLARFSGSTWSGLRERCSKLPCNSSSFFKFRQANACLFL
jgi:hypothetical protein